MRDTDFLVDKEKRHRFAACYALKDGKLELFDDPRKSPWFAPPKLESGGGGLAGTADDYLRFCRMLLNRGELDGVRLLSPKTVALMSANHLPGAAEIGDLSPAADAFNESGYRGIGHRLGVAVTLDPARVGISGTTGRHLGRHGSTTFFDPKEDGGGIHDPGDFGHGAAGPAAPRPAQPDLWSDDTAMLESLM
jgi:CubicO group peptidase (beta-lactamase class C family)